MKRILFILTLLITLPATVWAVSDTIVIQSGQSTVLLTQNQVHYFEDVTGKLSFAQLRKINSFNTPSQSVPNLGMSKSTFWLKFTLYNETDRNSLLLDVENSQLTFVRLYYPTDPNENYYTYLNSGNQYPMEDRKFQSQNIIFEIPVPPYAARTVYLEIKSSGLIVVPIRVGTENEIMQNLRLNDLLFGLYAGIILIMFFYNLFIYYVVKDETYLYYIVYILCIGLVSFCILGYGYRFLWNNSYFITARSVNWAGALAAIGTAAFLRTFLQTKKKHPFYDQILVGFILVLIAGILPLTLFGAYNVSYVLIDVISFMGSIAFWIIGYRDVKLGSRPAKFFLIAWSFFLLSVIIFVLKDYGMVPYNKFTKHILLLGSSIEISLLSLALADRINLYKKEKEESQAKALQSSRENERLMKEQNTFLETKVNERTAALRQANRTLNNALTDLKKAQSKLVEAEKMASLGQLTAGIAHEINNPINFVKANVSPLIMDIGDLLEIINKYEELNTENLETKLHEIETFKHRINFDYVKDEIKMLLHGIEDGASRTVEIVKGLRTFSHVDVNSIKEVDIHEGIEATLGLLRNHIPSEIKIIRQYGEIPKIECYPGKLNQVFMNILVNAIQAIKAQEKMSHEEITISTSYEDPTLTIRISDTGIGVPADIRQKIFDPFFTTKDVGEGTGLGLSIVFSIIEKHHGNIKVDPNGERGSTFVITLPSRVSI